MKNGLYIPPGTELASHGRRIGAWFLAIPLFIVTLGIGYIVWGLILWTEGTSPALKVLGMRVWRVALHDMIASTTVLYDPNKLLAPPKE